ncbi:MAG: UDP-glucose pyrophosphorylase [Myxococcales bacterium]
MVTHPLSPLSPDESALVEESLRRAGQDHVLAAMAGVPVAERVRRLTPLAGVPVERLASLVRAEVKAHPLDPARIAAPPWVALGKHDAGARERGEELLRDGKIATLLVAGGLGTRLGWDAPKGTFPIGPVTDRTLFQHFAETHRALGRRYGRSIPWAIQTSGTNHAATWEFLQAHGWFGLDPTDVLLFPQGDLPAFDPSGRILLDPESHVIAQPDGHGGVFGALERRGALRWLADRGVEHVFYFQVDNPLAPICDPAFLGHHALSGSRMSTLAVRKVDPAERVGVLCLRDGAPGIVEYSELPPEVATARAPDGGLLLRAGNTAIHAFTMELLAQMAHERDFPVHMARKPIPTGAASVEGIKLEYFVFDALPYAGTTLIMELDRATGFAPVKNADGADSPATARAAMSAKWRRWVERWDPRTVMLPEDTLVEVSPLVALDADELRSHPIPEAPPTSPLILR